MDEELKQPTSEQSPAEQRLADIMSRLAKIEAQLAMQTAAEQQATPLSSATTQSQGQQRETQPPGSPEASAYKPDVSVANPATDPVRRSQQFKSAQPQDKGPEPAGQEDPKWVQEARRDAKVMREVDQLLKDTDPNSQAPLPSVPFATKQSRQDDRSFDEARSMGLIPPNWSEEKFKNIGDEDFALEVMPRLENRAAQNARPRQVAAPVAPAPQGAHPRLSEDGTPVDDIPPLEPSTSLSYRQRMVQQQASQRAQERRDRIAVRRGATTREAFALHGEEESTSTVKPLPLAPGPRTMQAQPGSEQNAFNAFGSNMTEFSSAMAHAMATAGASIVTLQRRVEELSAILEMTNRDT